MNILKNKNIKKICNIAVVIGFIGTYSKVIVTLLSKSHRSTLDWSLATLIVTLLFVVSLNLSYRIRKI